MSFNEAEFDRACEEYLRKTLGWEFDLLELEQRADEAMREAADSDPLLHPDDDASLL